ncbi:arylsulfatase [Rubritalea spongiae]|uniref:Arylsulfatase n=1 Tax=Rubritalea spongiae TaxID=430797 RepID=A0ABW5E768_9BACT
MRKITLTTLLVLSSFAHAAERSPNVIVIFADDLGYGDLGCYGATKIKTPNIDKLAAEGRKFTDAHSASSVCTPSRYALITGEYPLRALGGKGMWGPSVPTKSLIIPPDTYTVADVFKEKGYTTGCIGKWHLGFKTGKNDWQPPLSPGPNDLGFDYYFGMPVVNSAPPYIYVENTEIVGGEEGDPLVYVGRKAKDAAPMPVLPPEASIRAENQFKGAKKAHELFVEEEIAPSFTEKAVDWIDQNKEKPFFLYLATTHIHHPFTPAPKFKGSSEAGLYGDFVQELDWMVGEITNALEEKGLSDDTLIVFTSDNGGMFNRGGQDAFALGHLQNGPLLGFKFGVWEGGHRVPFIAKWPGNIPAGSVSKSIVSNVDFLATFAALTGVEISPEQQKDSVNILPALTGEVDQETRDHLVLTSFKPSHVSIRKGKWMYIGAKGGGGWGAKQGHTFAGPPANHHTGKKNSDYNEAKLIADAPAAQLYNLEDDLAQTTNVYREHPEVVKEMEDILKSYRPNKNKRTR